jgi:hypothetical protein
MSPYPPPVRLQRRRLPHIWSCGTRGPRGRPPSPWLGRRPRRKRQAVTEAMPGGAARPGRGGQPAAVPQSYNRCRARLCYPLTTPAATDATTGRHGDRQPGFAGMAMSHRTPSGCVTTRCFIPWHGPGARLPGLVGRTCCRPDPERFSRQASPVGRRRRGWTGPRRSVARRPARRTAAAPTRRPRAGWSRTCRTRLAAGGWGSALPVPARTGAWGWATAGGRGRGRGG